MPARIAELDEGWRGRMAGWAREWIERGLATGPVDRVGVEEAIAVCYRLAGVRWPGRVVWVPSPVVGALAAPLAAHPLFNEDDVRQAEADAWVDGVHQPVRGSVAGELRGALHGRVRGAVSAAITGPVHQAVLAGVHGVVHRGLIEGIHSPVHRAVTDAVGQAADGRLEATVRAAALAAVGQASGEVPGRALDPLFVSTDQSVRAWTRQATSRLRTQAMYARWCWSLGGWGLDWPAYFSFLHQVCWLELPGDLWTREAALARSEAAAGWWWPHRRFVLVCERPAELHLEWGGPGGVPRLHNPDGPAIRWPDGWAVHALHGRRVPPPS